ncbi:MAG TPA: hypothetical protein PLL64_13340 [Rhodothermales bacterium]|nr:hypothetical protein [Bacteroidota bacterium]HRK75259.1 hypothetical protein [Rhodothermales bacterium]HRR08417.1 hypothetical protein [Rhodothermales bacterium]
MKRWLIGSFMILLVLTTTAGCTLNKLPEYNLRDQKMAVMAAIPPSPKIYSDFWYDTRMDSRNPWRTMLRIGTAVAKYIQVDKAEARLDSALQHVDVPEIMARKTLLSAAESIGYAPVSSVKDADFIMDLRIRQYGIRADSWFGATYLFVEGDVLIYDNQTNKSIWKRGVQVRDRVSRHWFGLGGGAGNIFTATDLAKLSVKDMETGFRNLAEFAGERIARSILDDYQRKRR